MPSLEKLPIESVLAGATRLYSVPAVAMEVVRLTDEPKVDIPALRDCIQRDPALTAKLLRVVNSSLYGLKGEVADLNQALALLGVNPLKLLVLGFSLPDRLFREVPPAALNRYWTETVTRAAAARLIADTFWKRQGDEAFIAGLLMGIGQLVLIDQLGEPYVALLDRLHDFPLKSSDEIGAVEASAIGFDHRTLSANLLERWALPERITWAIRAQTEPVRIAGIGSEEDCLPHALRLAELVMQLVERKLFNALPDLVEEGERYCELSRRGLNELIVELEPNVALLAEAMDVEVDSTEDYRQTLLDAQAQLSVVSEEVVSGLLTAVGNPDTEALDAAGEAVLAEAQDLSDSIRAFLEGAPRKATGRPATTTAHAPKSERATVRAPHLAASRDADRQLLAEVARQAEACRNARRPLTLALCSVEGVGAPIDSVSVKAFRECASGPRWEDELRSAVWIALSPNEVAVVLPGAERHGAVKLLTSIVETFAVEQGMMADSGVAAVELASKGFESIRLIEAARRCLDAARATGVSTVKSIEVY